MSDYNEEIKELNNRIEYYKESILELKEAIKDIEEANRWKPEGGGHYINSGGECYECASDTHTREFGAERKTREQAEQAAIAMRRFNRLLAYKDEFAPEYVFNRDFNNYYVFFDYDNTFRIDATSVYCQPTTVFFPEDVARELCKKLNSGKVVL